MLLRINISNNGGGGGGGGCIRSYIFSVVFTRCKSVLFCLWYSIYFMVYFCLCPQQIEQLLLQFGTVLKMEIEESKLFFEYTNV